MRALVVIFCFVAAVAGVPANPQRIVGGSTTTIDEYPSIVVLLYSRDLVTYAHSCGGTVLSSKAILTAAHCTVGDIPSQWRVRAGSTSSQSGGTVFNVASYVNHENYNGTTLDNDISIMHVSGTIVFFNAIQPATIAGTSYSLADNEAVWAAGWGTTAPGGTTSETLLHVEIWTVNQDTCRERYTEMGATVTDNMLCSGWLDVGGRDQCQGDSGGPLYHNNIVVGVCSWGMSCALAYYPGVNARVSRYTAWIQANV